MNEGFIKGLEQKYKLRIQGEKLSSNQQQLVEEALIDIEHVIVIPAELRELFVLILKWLII